MADVRNVVSPSSPVDGGTQSQSTAIDDSSYDCLNVVRVLLVYSDFEQLLMVHNGDQWDLPYFEYPPGSLHSSSDIAPFCKDFRKWLQLDSSVQCTVLVELLGWVHLMGKVSDDKYGNAALYVMQLHGIRPENLKLSAGVEWKSTSFLSEIAESSDANGMRLIKQKCITYMSSRGIMKDKRNQLEWYARASDFLRKTTVQDGAVVKGAVQQTQMTYASTIIKLNSSKGWYFAKAPCLGSNEATITSKISQLFPESSPVLLSVNTELGCFVSRGFRDVKPKFKDINVIVQKLADMQLGSLSYLEELKNAGCALRGPNEMKATIKTMADFEFITGADYVEGCYKNMAPVMQNLCDQLTTFNIPSTLVHGDFALSNAVLGNGDEEGVLLFDWQCACIAHPFCDFHRLYEDIPEEMREEVVEQYLGRWSEFEDMPRAKEAFHIARCLGWLLMMWTASECQESCEHQRESDIMHWCRHLVNMSAIALSNAGFITI